jgi:fatty acid synthase subunit alpha
LFPRILSSDFFDSRSQFFASGKLVVIKEGAPYDPELETPVLLNPLARTVDNAKTGSFAMPKKLPSSAYPTDKASNAAIASKLVAAATAGVSSVGTDVELISAIPSDNETFLERNFTANELAYCRSSPDFKASLAARWAAKEATVSSFYLPFSRSNPR